MSSSISYSLLDSFYPLCWHKQIWKAKAVQSGESTWRLVDGLDDTEDGDEITDCRQIVLTHAKSIHKYTNILITLIWHITFSR